MTSIREIHGREILDSRGHPTLEVAVILDDGTSGRAAVPAGASTGQYEAQERRDQDPERYQGRGVLQAIDSVESSISPALVGLAPFDQATIDKKLLELDPTADKHNLGANAILGVSLAVARASAASRQVPLFRHLNKDEDMLLPVPLLNILNGGRHAQGSVDFQEFMIIPVGFSTFSEALRCGVEIYHALGNLLRDHRFPTTVGDEGGFAPPINSYREALNLVVASIEAAKYKPGLEVFLGLDVAASELFHGGNYDLPREGITLSAAELVEVYKSLCQDFPLISIEDGLGENDWDGWHFLTQALDTQIQIVGDDLFTTNPQRIQRGIRERCGNAVLIKPNQIGTLTETLAAIRVAKEAGWLTIISHRSGETEDTFIADLAVATGAGQIKSGAPARGERTAKYNRLLLIEADLGPQSRYAGKEPFSRFDFNSLSTTETA